jgi:hypothetical protein
MADDDELSEPRWYSVRCVFQIPAADGFAYEERVTLWQAEDIDQAIALAEAEAARFADETQGEYTGLAQAYYLVGSPSSGMEVFSLIRQSPLDSDDYLDSFFDTGQELQGRWSEE